MEEKHQVTACLLTDRRDERETSSYSGRFHHRAPLCRRCTTPRAASDPNSAFVRISWAERHLMTLLSQQEHVETAHNTTDHVYCVAP
ncbi:hypothetical protein J6590_026020 [Homalodisca vitripennis]|nr:hypothetical protein J6590_026020 [Homalodisca vitripennis]